MSELRRGSSPPVALTIAGSDNSCGAGAQADLKTFEARGVHGLTALTCVVSEVPGKVERVQALPAAMVRSQIRILLEHFPVAAVKTGMLFSRHLVEAVAGELRRDRGRFRLVVDPVMVASSGDPLLQPEAIAAYKRLLLPLADVVTPNLDEASVLLDRPLSTLRDLRQAARELAGDYGTAFLVKGGHLRGSAATDVLCYPDGRSEEMALPRWRGAETHGTGCTYAACLAAELACGHDLGTAFRHAKSWLHAAIGEAREWDGPAGRVRALNHGVRPLAAPRRRA